MVGIANNIFQPVYLHIVDDDSDCDVGEKTWQGRRNIQSGLVVVDKCIAQVAYSCNHPANHKQEHYVISI